MAKIKNKPFRTTIDGYYIHDVRKSAQFAFEDFLIHVKYNPKNHCYDILLRDCITDKIQSRELCKAMLAKFRAYYPKSFNVIILSEMQVGLMLS